MRSSVASVGLIAAFAAVAPAAHVQPPAAAPDGAFVPHAWLREGQRVAQAAGQQQ